MSNVSPKTERKNKIMSLQESISKVQSDITLYKSCGNTIAIKASKRVLQCLEQKLLDIKRN